jgi:hypothetical protein
VLLSGVCVCGCFFVSEATAEATVSSSLRLLCLTMRVCAFINIYTHIVIYIYIIVLPRLRDKGTHTHSLRVCRVRPTRSLFLPSVRFLATCLPHTRRPRPRPSAASPSKTPRSVFTSSSASSLVLLSSSCASISPPPYNLPCHSPSPLSLSRVQAPCMKPKP